MNAAQPIRAPQGAVAWTATHGFLYEPDEMPAHVEASETLLVVSDDGAVRGVQPHDRAPLSAVLRIEGDLVEIVARLDDLGDTAAGVVRETQARTDALVARADTLAERADTLAARVGDLGDQTAGLDAAESIDIGEIRAKLRGIDERVRRLESG